MYSHLPVAANVDHVLIFHKFWSLLWPFHNIVELFALVLLPYYKLLVILNIHLFYLLILSL